jgi:xanthine dehydrogenase iron-sulfur cluster and FAD-binding subunit A
MQELLKCKAEHPHARIMGGNTEVGIEMRIKGAAYPVLIDATRVPELQVLEGDSSSTSLLVWQPPSVLLTSLGFEWGLSALHLCP